MYIVSRTSVWGDEKPCDEAIVVEGHIDRSPRSHLTNRPVSELAPEVQKFWAVKKTLEWMHQKYGDIVVRASGCKEYPIEVEIYDDYRE